MITLTDAAKNKIARLIRTRGGVGIRIGVKTTGCSGLAYILEYLDSHTPTDTTVNFDQIEFIVVVDKKDLVYVAGTLVDYVRQGLNEGFEFKNPNERDRCGCGESFRV